MNVTLTRIPSLLRGYSLQLQQRPGSFLQIANHSLLPIE